MKIINKTSSFSPSPVTLSSLTSRNLEILTLGLKAQPFNLHQSTRRPNSAPLKNPTPNNTSPNSSSPNLATLWSSCRRCLNSVMLPRTTYHSTRRILTQRIQCAPQPSLCDRPYWRLKVHQPKAPRRPLVLAVSAAVAAIVAGHASYLPYSTRIPTFAFPLVSSPFSSSFIFSIAYM